VINGNQYQPDVDGWNPKPPLNQRIAPIINSCPPPLLWIEVKTLVSLSPKLCNYFLTISEPF